MAIELDNFEEVMSLIENLADTRNLDEALTKACAVVEASAKQKAPKGNGELRRSISSKVDGEKGIVFTPLEYAPYVEYGTGLFAEVAGRKDTPWSYQDERGQWHTTSGMHPSPYMRPALEENREKIVSILKEGLLND